MKKELDDQLCTKYPKIFADRHSDVRTTAMCFGFEVNDGWYNLLNTLCRCIQNYIDQSQESIDWTTKFNDELAVAKENNFENWPTYATREPRKVPNPVQQVVATQVKEKFGTLRFYYCGGDDYIEGLIDMACELSAVTCEICGSPGKTIGNSWLETRCPEHSGKDV